MKFCAPHPSKERIDRPALFERLTQTSGVPFILISAPAGYGKSTLLAQWSAQKQHAGPGRIGRTCHQPCATVTLDKNDNDPVSFWTNIVRSTKRTCPGIDDVRLVRSLNATRRDLPYLVLPELVEEIHANCPHILLIFDNYHTITEPECHEQVEYLLNHLPSQACLMLATRTDPPFSLARFRASGDIVELRTGDLCFTRDEVACLVRLLGGYHLENEQLTHLIDYTEGWPAVVHLVARLLKDQPDPAAFLRCFDGDNRYVAEYLEEEVLRHLPGEVQRFLTRTAILDRFTAPLCDTVADTANSADLINGMDRSNLFLVPLDTVRTWYRYHRLFGQTVRGHLARTEPDACVSLHEKASEWYERNACTGDAIRHALSAGAVDRATRLLARHWAHHVYQGELAVIRTWLDALGEHVISRSPLTAICAAWVTALSGDRPHSRRWLETVERLGHCGPLPDGMYSARGAVALYQGTFGFGGFTEMLTAARTAAELHGDPTTPWYAQARAALGYSHYLAGNLRAALPPLRQAVEAAAAFPVLHIIALSTLSLVTGDLGRVGQAADLAAAARKLGATAGLGESPETSLAPVAYAAVLVREGHLLRARRELEHAVRVRRPLPGLPPWPTLTALILLARTTLTLGDRNSTRALLGEATDLLETVPDGAEQVRADLAELDRRLGTEHSRVTAPRLTHREEAVLRLLPGSLPLREVAAQLFVTVNTVKSHTRLIYRKLGVSSRAEAVRRARALGLL